MVPVVWPMQARMLAVLKRNIERADRARTQALPVAASEAGVLAVFRTVRLRADRSQPGLPAVLDDDITREHHLVPRPR
jgi:hypothetical protein